MSPQATEGVFPHTMTKNGAPMSEIEVQKSKDASQPRGLFSCREEGEANKPPNFMPRRGNSQSHNPLSCPEGETANRTTHFHAAEGETVNHSRSPQKNFMRRGCRDENNCKTSCA